MIDNNILIFDYKYHKHLKNEILNDLINYEDVQNRSTFVKATMTEWNINSLEIMKLKYHIIEKMHDKKIIKSKDKIYFTNFWANIYRKFDYTLPHDHLYEDFSFIYFLNSKFWFSSVFFPEIEKKIIPKEGKCIIFNSSMIHEVRKHRYSDLRITLSGDMKYTI